MSIRQYTTPVAFTNSSGAKTKSFPAPTVAGNVIVFCLNTYNGGGGVDLTSLADDKGGGSNTYTAYKSASGSARTMFFVAENAGVMQQFTYTPNGGNDVFAQAIELDEAPASSVLADTPVFTYDPVSASDLSVTSGTPSQAGNYVIAMCGGRESFGSFSLTDPASGYTQLHLDTTQSGALMSSSLAARVGSGAAQTAAWSHGNGSPMSAGIIIVKQTFAGGSANPLVFLRRGGPGMASPNRLA